MALLSKRVAVMGNFFEFAIDDSLIDMSHGIPPPVAAARVRFEGEQGHGILHEQVAGDCGFCAGKREQTDV